MRIRGLKKFWIMVRIIWKTCLISLGRSLPRQTRAQMDHSAYLWSCWMLQIVRAQYQIFNHSKFEFLPGRPYIIMSNHLSLYDIPLIFMAFPGSSVRMIAKKELFKIPIFGAGIRAGECIAIDRTNHRQALKDLEVAKAKILSGIRLWLAPEGTRSRTGELGSFKRGGFKLALDTQAIIVPVVILGSNKILPPGTFDFSLNERVELHIGNPIDTRLYQNGGLRKLMVDMEQEFRKYL